jgi:hypothetical protein
VWPAEEEDTYGALVVKGRGFVGDGNTVALLVSDREFAELMRDMRADGKIEPTHEMHGVLQ